MKSLQLTALKSAERFVKAEIDSEPHEPSRAETRIVYATETLQIIQRAIVAGELEPDYRLDMLNTLKRALHALNRAPRFDTGLETLTEFISLPRMSSYALASEIEAVIRKVEG